MSGKSASWLLAGIAVAWPWQLSAVPIGKAAAEAAARGWLEEERPHLSARFHSQVYSTETFSGFHVVHLKPEGFIVTADDDELEPVLAFSDRGDFKYDPENPLCILLNRDVPARKDHLRNVKSRHANPSAASPALAQTDRAALGAAEHAKAKWEKYKKTVSLHRSVVSVIQPGITAALAGASNTPTAPVQIGEIKIVDGHVQLTHDARSSVSVYASYDFGQTWQVVDAGVIWPDWTAKRSVQESSCWYRVEPDGVYDEMAVSLMRHPPPASPEPDNLPADFASDPGGTGLAGSKGTVSDIRVAPLVQSVWNQGTANGANCYNYYTPNNSVDGCVATALAQLMRYWQHPTAGVGQVSRTIYFNGSPQTATTRGGNGSGGPYNWSSMPLNPQSTAYNLAQWQMIGALCYDAGVSVNMQYTVSSSGAYMYLCAGALSSVFQYANAKYVNYPGNLLTPIDSNLAAGCPVLLGISSSGGNGHAVVCDGFGYDTGTLYHHINMGWAGSYNYWYALPYLETPYNFNSIDTIIYNIFPTGSGELLTGRITTSQAAPVAGVTVVASASGQNYSATTDAKGYYGIKVPSARTYSVTASKTGMNTATRTGVVIGTSSTSASGNVIGADFTLNNNFSFTAVGLTNSVWLRWSVPTNSGMANNTVYIRHRTDRYPNSSSDGSLVYSGTTQVFEHIGADASGSATNFYTIWGDNGSPYASLGSSVNAFSIADPGAVRLLWTGSGGEVVTWNIKTNGTKKSGGYVSSGAVDMSYWKIVGYADIDRDGTADILWTGAGGEVYYWLLNADGTKRLSGAVSTNKLSPATYWKVAGFADIDRDGTADILWTGAGGEVYYWMLNPDGTKRVAGSVTASKLSPTNYWTVAGFGDIDRDGTADVLWTGAGGEIYYWMLNPDGTKRATGLASPTKLTPATYWKASGFADINQDTVPDILWVGGGGEVYFWLLNADGTKKSTGSVKAGNATSSGYWTVAGFKDVDGDGAADIILRGQGGETSCWLLNSNGTCKSSLTMQTAAASYWTVRGATSLSPNLYY